MEDFKITDPAILAAILAYCKADRGPMYVVHTPPESSIGGFSCQLLSIDGDTALTRIANGDIRIVPVVEIHARGVL